jgi:hypothetical protein
MDQLLCDAIYSDIWFFGIVHFAMTSPAKQRVIGAS